GHKRAGVKATWAAANPIQRDRDEVCAESIARSIRPLSKSRNAIVIRPAIVPQGSCSSLNNRHVLFHSLPCDSFFVRPRLLVLIVAYKAEKTVQTVLTRIPARLQDLCDVEVLV